MTTEIITQPEEIARRTELEEIIQAGQKTFVEVGNALTEICDARLYRWTHRTFKEYCEQKWGMGKSQSYRIMEAALLQKKLTAKVEEVLGSKHLSPIGDIPNENVARNLAKLPERQQVAIAIEAVKNGSEITESAVSEVKAKRKHTAKVRLNSEDGKPGNWQEMDLVKGVPEPQTPQAEVEQALTSILKPGFAIDTTPHGILPTPGTPFPGQIEAKEPVEFAAKVWNKEQILVLIDEWWREFKPKLAYTSIAPHKTVDDLKIHIGKL